MSSNVAPCQILFSSMHAKKKEWNQSLSSGEMSYTVTAAVPPSNLSVYGINFYKTTGFLLSDLRKFNKFLVRKTYVVPPKKSYGKLGQTDNGMVWYW